MAATEWMDLEENGKAKHHLYKDKKNKEESESKAILRCEMRRAASDEI